MPADVEADPPAAPEPIFNSPWPSLAVVASILLSYAWQAFGGGGQASADLLGFRPADLEHGRWWTLVTILIVHGGWAHAVMNALGALAFGAPVARLMGEDIKGAAGFFGFYLLCGVVSGLGYAALHLHDVNPVIGASGAVSGLMGAASRLFGGRNDLAPIWSRGVVSLGASWVIINALMAVFGATPFMPGAQIAWEAHIAGFIAGVLLIGPVARLVGSR